MPKVTEIIKPYFSHDLSTLQDKAIKKLVHDLGFEGYGLFWAIVEFMHQNELKVDEEYLVIDERYSDKIKSILNDYNLFRVDNDVYISDRILRNISKQEEKSNKGKANVNARWLISAYSNAYEKEFGIIPILDDSEKKKLIDYSKRIENFKELLPDILYTLHNIKFSNDINFNPASNWLLEKNNLSQILNGQWGKLLHKTSKKEQEKNKLEIEATLKEAKKFLSENCAKDSLLCCSIEDYTRLTELKRTEYIKEFLSLYDKFQDENKALKELTKIIKEKES